MAFSLTMSKRRAKTKSTTRSSTELTDAELSQMQALADQAVQETLRELGLSDAESASPANELKIDWLRLYLETPRFLSTGYRLQKTSRKTRHHLGGGTGGPPCGACGTPLILFADLDATDQRLSGDHSLQRLPLYYCCSCPGPVYYQIESNGKASAIPSHAHESEEAPFENPPKFLRAGFLNLTPISAGAERAIFMAVKQDGFDSLSKSQMAEIATILGRRPRGRWEMYFSQIGGVPLTFQGEEGMPDICPNRRCPIRRRRRDEFKYRPLAVLDLWNDDFWPIKPLDAVQIVFHVCPGCLCISAIHVYLG